MAKTSHEIETHINNTRDKLGSNLHELEEKVQSATDWKAHFQENPMTMMGLAMGGGIILAAMLGNRKRHRVYDTAYLPEQQRTPHAGTDRQKHLALETLDDIKGALIGVAATRVKEFMGDVVPGFSEHIQRTIEQKKKTTNDASTSAVPLH